MIALAFAFAFAVTQIGFVVFLCTFCVLQADRGYFCFTNCVLNCFATRTYEDWHLPYTRRKTSLSYKKIQIRFISVRSAKNLKMKTQDQLFSSVFFFLWTIVLI